MAPKNALPGVFFSLHLSQTAPRNLSTSFNQPALPFYLTFFSHYLKWFVRVRKWSIWTKFKKIRGHFSDRKQLQPLWLFPLNLPLLLFFPCPSDCTIPGNLFEPELVFSVLQGIVWWQTKQAGEGQQSMALPQAIIQDRQAWTVWSSKENWEKAQDFSVHLQAKIAILMPPMQIPTGALFPSGYSRYEPAQLRQGFHPQGGRAWIESGIWFWIPLAGIWLIPALLSLQLQLWFTTHLFVPLAALQSPCKRFSAETKFRWCSPNKQTIHTLPCLSHTGRGAPLLIPVQQCWALLHPGISKAAP